MTDNSSVDFKAILFQLWIKGSHQNPNFATFKCSGENLQYSLCHFPNHKLTVMLDKSVNNVLGEGMQFLDKCSPLSFNFGGLSTVCLKLYTTDA